jgi:hypothetical protein
MNSISMSCRAALVGLALVGCAATAPAQRWSSQADSIRRLVAAQASLDVIAWNLGFRSEPGPLEIELTPIERLDSTTTIWRATVSNLTHWPPYTLATVGSRVLRLGGFPAPELEMLAASLPAPLSLRDAANRAERLAVAADRGSAALVLGRNQPAAVHAAVVKAWASKRPLGWPSDRVQMLPDGKIRVALTTLSSKEWSGQGPMWAPVTYVFLFGRDGRLLLWSSHEGDAFTVP